MAFCKYCGSQLEEGQTCSCAGAQAAANPQPQATEGVQAAQPVNAAPNQTAEAAKAVATNVGTELVDVCKKFFTAPVELFEEVYTSTSQIAEFVILGIFTVFSLLFISLLMEYADSPFLIGLGVTVGLVAIKVVYALFAYLTKDTEGTFVNALSLFSVTTIPGIVFVLVIFLFAKMAFPVGEISVAIIWLVVDTIYSFLAFKTIIKNSNTKAINVFVIVTVVITFIVVAIGYNKAVDLVTEMTQNAIYDAFDSMW